MYAIHPPPLILSAPSLSQHVPVSALPTITKPVHLSLRRMHCVQHSAALPPLYPTLPLSPSAATLPPSTSMPSAPAVVAVNTAHACGVAGGYGGMDGGGARGAGSDGGGSNGGGVDGGGGDGGGSKGGADGGDDDDCSMYTVAVPLTSVPSLR